MRKRRSLCSVLCGLLILSFLSLVPLIENANAQMTMRLLGFLPPDHHLTETGEILKKEIEKNTDGDIEIKHYPSQQLYNHKSSVTPLQNGSIEMALVQTGFWTGKVPSISVLAFMSFFNSFEHYEAVMEGYPGDVFAKDFEEQANLKVLGWANYDKLEVASKDPIRNLEDFQGERIRAPGGEFAAWLDNVGAAPVTMNSGEVYQALQRGTIDGAVSGPTSFDQRKWYEVVKYRTDSSLSPVYNYFMVIHLDAWNKLTDEQKNIFKAAADKAHEYNIEASRELQRETDEKLTNEGMKAIKISDEELARWREKALPPLLERYKNRVGEEKAQKILNSIEKLREQHE